MIGALAPSGAEKEQAAKAGDRPGKRGGNRAAGTAGDRRGGAAGSLGAGPACGAGGPIGAAAFRSGTSESLHLRYASKDGDVLELDYEYHEEISAGVAFPRGSRGSRGGGGVLPGRPDNPDPAGENAAAAAPAEADADERLAKLARLRDWAAQAAEEVRRQQQRILEEYLKRSGRFAPGCEGRYIVVIAPEPEEAAAAADCEAGIPEYWNAENTSDRIVHFATQMAEIAGGDLDFAETIVKAVADGFDQANAETGPLPGAAGELNKKTRELTFAKLSKWLEDRKAMLYNQGARTETNPNPEASHGIENHEQ